MARAFYTAEILGISKEMHEPLFNAIHVKRMNLRNEDQMASLFSEAGAISKEAFTKAYDSFFVRSRVMQAQAKSRAYGITGVPTMIVNGKYRVDGRMAGSNQGMLDVVDFLVEQSAQKLVSSKRSDHQSGRWRCLLVLACFFLCSTRRRLAENVGWVAIRVFGRFLASAINASTRAIASCRFFSWERCVAA